MRSRQGSRFAPGVRATLALLALLPLAGLGWFSVRALQTAAERVDTAAEIEVRAPQVTRLAALDSSLSTETYWASAIAAATVIGVTPDFIVDIIGIDMVQEFESAKERVDGQLDELSLQILVAPLADARALAESPVATSSAIDGAYRVVKDELEIPIQAQLNALTALAANVPNSLEMTRTADALAESIELREQASGVAFGYFAARYPSAAAEENPAANLLQWTTLYDAAGRRLDLVLEAGSSLSTQWTAVQTDPRVVDLLERSRSSTGALATGGDGQTGIDLASIDIDAESSAFIDSLAAVDLHLEFIDAVGFELAMIAAGVERDAEDSQRSTILTTAIVVGVSLLAIAVASWWIIGPLRRLSETVAAMREGELGGHATVSGPHEVRAAARALNEAADHLKLAEEQAAVLAEADLDHPVLSQTPPGKLGASLQHAVQQLATSLAEREEFRERLEYEATHDGLTDLTNRSAAIAGLARSVARVRRSEDDLAVLFIDVDEFKQVNDRFGHNAGDVVLRTIAERIQDAVREGDLVGRIGGDEFLVIAEPVADAHEAMIVASRVLECVSQPITIDDNEIHAGVSIGVSVAGNNDLSPDELLRDADLAVYRAKDLGRSRVEVCDVGLRDELAERMDIETALRGAISNDELVMHYQPVVDASDDSLVSLEALVRWDRPGVGLVLPDSFVPVAERSRLIVALDVWVLRTVVAQMAEWTHHPVLGDVTVAVNASARHLATPTLAADVLEALDTEGVEPHRLTLEITESALLHDLEGARAQLDVLRGRGVRVALDDFGTGYTSLAHLRQLPVDVLKIDQSFVKNLDRSEERTLVGMIVDTGHLLGASVTAEGVETLEQASDLAEIGSDHLQGYRYSTPLNAEALEASIEDTARP